MPLDAATYGPALDPATLYRERRERAVALWLDVSPEQFNMGSWKEWKSRTTACALGWLAECRVDEWEWALTSATPTWRGKKAINAAAMYFAIARSEALVLFGNGLSHKTAARVGVALLALPYFIPDLALTPEPLPCR